MSVDYRYQNAFNPWQGDSNLSEHELGTLRRRAWQEQGILIVSPSDDRLQSSEQIVLCEVGSRLYGDEPAA